MIGVDRRHTLGLARAERLAESMGRRLQDEYGGSYASNHFHPSCSRFPLAGEHPTIADLSMHRGAADACAVSDNGHNAGAEAASAAKARP